MTVTQSTLCSQRPMFLQHVVYNENNCRQGPKVEQSKTTDARNAGASPGKLQLIFSRGGATRSLLSFSVTSKQGVRGPTAGLQSAGQQAHQREPEGSFENQLQRPLRIIKFGCHFHLAASKKKPMGRTREKKQRVRHFFHFACVCRGSTACEPSGCWF